MRLYKTVLVGALICNVSVLAMAGCSDDDEPAKPSGGTGGGGTGGGGTGGGGTGGRGGTGGGGTGGSTGGSAGTGGAACMPTDMAKAQCKAMGADSGSCAALTECACNSCVCELSACEANANCKAIRACATRTGCCGPADTRCTAAGRGQCSMHPECGPLIVGAQDAGSGFMEIVALSGCVYNATEGNCTNQVCFSDGGTTDGGTDSGGDSSTDSGGGG